MIESSQTLEQPFGNEISVKEHPVVFSLTNEFFTGIIFS